MRYLGGKKRIGREIAEVLEKCASPTSVCGYVEPFCGALGVMIHMLKKDYKVYEAYDLCKDLILLWKEIKAGQFVYPNSVTEKTWSRYRKSSKDKKKPPSSMKAFMGFGLSFGGVWFSSYGDNYTQNSGRSVFKETVQSLKDMEPYIKKINKIGCKSYTAHKFENYLIYCDPPYKNTSGYDAVCEFDSGMFWETVRQWSKNNIVIVSEFSAPKDFLCVWKKKRNVKKFNEPSKIGSDKTEKLFIHETLKNKINL